jgi:hypothetical protein
MHATRIVLVTVLAPVFAAIPYFAAAVWGFADSGGGPPAQGALVCIVLVLFGATAAVLCLGIARIVWKNREKVSRRFLFGVPVGIAAVFLFLIGVLPGLIVGDGAWSTFPVAFGTALVSALAGRLAAVVWLKYAYDSDEQV